MNLDDELAHVLWAEVSSRLPEGSIFALAVQDGHRGLVVSNVIKDEDVESFLRVMADRHATDKVKPNDS